MSAGIDLRVGGRYELTIVQRGGAAYPVRYEIVELVRAGAKRPVPVAPAANAHGVAQSDPAPPVAATAAPTSSLRPTGRPKRQVSAYYPVAGTSLAASGV